MKWKIWLIATVTLIIYGCKDAEAHEIETVSVEEMKNHLKYGEVQLVDVRSKEDFSKSHLFNATNIIYDEAFRNNLEKLDKLKPVAVYCTAGNRSEKAAKILQEAGFIHIYILDGGIKKWVNHKEKVEQ
ncbi:rhodanese-like domain-containing protein [Gillisia sp. M10.2A]|uniref:Rhodanese-like domain-containing protein n=1 Tax=Gillisia lutea TaxID=2909668 RepID=A0ABS9EHX7_9FLAO|nr:rhodanese-like domain-containing protein [Gillisia lutea]MCF4102470.1 rhodanese-like domain-containing protein [Gillisia lutea]